MTGKSDAPRDVMEINSSHSKIFLLTITLIFLAKSWVLTVLNSGELMETIFDFINQDVNQFFNHQLLIYKLECELKKSLINSGPILVHSS